MLKFFAETLTAVASGAQSLSQELQAFSIEKGIVKII
jgi:hypothetical protein